VDGRTATQIPPETREHRPPTEGRGPNAYLDPVDFTADELDTLLAALFECGSRAPTNAQLRDDRIARLRLGGDPDSPKFAPTRSARIPPLPGSAAARGQL